jgi:hypothetical protein
MRGVMRSLLAEVTKYARSLPVPHPYGYDTGVA